MHQMAPHKDSQYLSLRYNPPPHAFQSKTNNKSSAASKSFSEVFLVKQKVKKSSNRAKSIHQERFRKSPHKQNNQKQSELRKEKRVNINNSLYPKTTKQPVSVDKGRHSNPKEYASSCQGMSLTYTYLKKQQKEKNGKGERSKSFLLISRETQNSRHKHQLSLSKQSDKVFNRKQRDKMKENVPHNNSKEFARDKCSHSMRSLQKALRHGKATSKSQKLLYEKVYDSVKEYKQATGAQRRYQQYPKKNKDKQAQQQGNIDTLRFQYSYRTRKGQNINNPKKMNQDSILIKQNINREDLHMIAVADGHGPHGHHISQFIIKTLSQLFTQQIEKHNLNKHVQKINVSKNQKMHSQNIKLEESSYDLSKIVPKIYDKIQNQLTCSEINSASSGSTLVNVIMQQRQLLCANVGDSRAILARQMDRKNWELIYLSEDHKPENENERSRILKNGGRIHSFKGQNGQSLGPLRVWLPNQNIQGLAMSRSFGDNISKPIGVTHQPELIRVNIDERDKFLLIASDGVWEFIHNQEILQLVAPFYREKKLEEACDALLKLAYERWTVEDDSVVDDISFVLVFLHC